MIINLFLFRMSNMLYHLCDIYCSYRSLLASCQAIVLRLRRGQYRSGRNKLQYKIQLGIIPTIGLLRGH